MDQPMGNGSSPLHDAAKSSDIVVVCGNIDGKSSRLVADEIWHLLRNRIVVSLNDCLTLAPLREMYPLSKVGRCRLYVDAEVERTLSLLALDSSYSDADLTSIRDIFGRMGEVLLLKEEIFENLNRDMDLSMAVIAEVAKALGDSARVDADLFEYALSWVLVSLGSAGIAGRDLSEILPRSPAIDDEVLALLRKHVAKASVFKKSKKPSG